MTETTITREQFNAAVEAAYREGYRDGYYEGDSDHGRYVGPDGRQREEDFNFNESNAHAEITA